MRAAIAASLGDVKANLAAPKDEPPQDQKQGVVLIAIRSGGDPVVKRRFLAETPVREVFAWLEWANLQEGAVPSVMTGAPLTSRQSSRPQYSEAWGLGLGEVQPAQSRRARTGSAGLQGQPSASSRCARNGQPSECAPTHDRQPEPHFFAGPWRRGYIARYCLLKQGFPKKEKFRRIASPDGDPAHTAIRQDSSGSEVQTKTLKELGFESSEMLMLMLE